MQRSRTPSNLSESLHQRLNSYALAASAAGVSVLALVQPAKGRIVYTATHHTIGKNSHYKFDLNHDGKTDFVLSNHYFCGTDNCWSALFATPKDAHVVAGPSTGGGFDWAYGLRLGDRIGPNDHFSALYLLIATNGSCWGGAWCNVAHRYLGLRFEVHQQTHYGWARLSVEASPNIKAVLTGYAYETVPNKPIIAGKTHGKDVITLEPASLGHLARGASGIAAWCRTKRISSEEGF